MKSCEGSARIDEAEIAAGNLPVQLTSLVGREQALSELSSLLWRSRLLTPVRSGGAGKTRLAAALAEAVRGGLRRAAPGGWICRPRATPRWSRMWSRRRCLPGEPASDSPSAALARRFAESSLLILDNCEQVDRCQRRARQRAARTDPVTAGDRDQPSAARSPRRAGMARAGAARRRARSMQADGAVQLFLERAREAASSFDPDAPGVRETVARICRWADGMPLAIELAAARVPALGVRRSQSGWSATAASCATRAGRRPRATARCRTRSSGVTGCSSQPSRGCFAGSARFSGSFSLAAAETVCADDALAADDVLELLSLLVDRSLVQVVEDGGRPGTGCSRPLASMRPRCSRTAARRARPASATPPSSGAGGARPARA